MSSPLTPLRTWRPRSKTRRVSPQISSVLSSLESSSKMVALFLTITSKKSQLFTWSSDFAVVCKSSLRPSPVRPSLSMLSHLTLLKTSRLRSRTRKVSPQISSASSSLESSSKTAEPSATTTFKRSQPSTWFFASAVVCKSSLRPSLVRPSHSMLSPLTQLRTWRPKSRTRKASPQISSASSSLESNSKTAAPSVTTTSKRSQPSTWFFASAVASEDSWSPAPAPLIIILPKPCALSTFLNFLLHFHC